jgi:hypothetical protein
MKNKILGSLMIALAVFIFIGSMYVLGGLVLLKELFAVLGAIGFVGLVGGLIAGGIIKLSK